MDLGNVGSILQSFFNNWMVQALLGLVVVDLGLGLFAALRAGKFDFARVGQFYQTNVVPYVGGFLVLFVAINYLFPMTPEGGTVIDIANQGTIGLAWATLVSTMASSIMQSFNALYKAEPPSGTLH